LSSESPNKNQVELTQPEASYQAFYLWDIGLKLLLPTVLQQHQID
jgi:hypothetical protein